MIETEVQDEEEEEAITRYLAGQEDFIEEETPKRRAQQAHSLPRIAYHKALNTPVAPGHTLGDCPDVDFQELIEISILTSDSPLSCINELQGCEYSEPLWRWFCFETLAKYKAILPIFVQ